MRLSGSYNGTGAAVYISLGFVPDWVKLIACEDGDLASADWARGMRAAEVIEGIRYVGSSGALQVAALTAGNGVQPYEGGETLTSALQTSTAYGEGVYLAWDYTNYAKDLVYGGVSALTNWTLDTAGNRTGHFNADVVASGNRIGEGSEILIKEDASGMVKQAVILAVTAGQGEAADEVTLSRAIGKGTIIRIGGMYNFAPLPIGAVTKAGIKINATSVLNVNDEIQTVIAGTDDLVF